jgi:AAHS family 4-hydroxybenzoate transporter-like MFS transporter
VSALPAAAPQRLTIDVSEVIEGQKLGWFIVRLILVSWLVTFFDGFDMNVIAFAAPYLAPAYQLDKPMLANVFSSGIAGTLIGGFLFGFLGDRFGRRSAILLATVVFGVLTLALAMADQYWEFLVLRFAGGLALGGAIPLTWALSVEYAPRRYRATLVTLIMMGYGLGVSAAGPISVALIPRFGWSAVFIFGGAVSLVAAIVLYRALPESLRFLATRSGDGKAMAHIVRRLAPDRPGLDDARFILSGHDVPVRDPRGPAVLFQGTLRWITPLLWLGYAASSMAAFFFTTWGPLVFEDMGLTRNTAALASSLNSLAGAVGGLVLMRFTDRIGAISVALLPAVAVPFLVIIGFVPVSQQAFLIMMGVLYVFLGGSHYGVISVAGTFYPTRHRALGTGWASGIGKLGSVAGPWLGGWILAANIPVQRTFAVLAICPAVFFVCMLGIGLMERRGRVQAAA